MRHSISRRKFLRTVVNTSAVEGAGEWMKLGAISPASAEEAAVTPE